MLGTNRLIIIGVVRSANFVRDERRLMLEVRVRESVRDRRNSALYDTEQVFNVELTDERAEAVATTVQAGSTVYVEGRVRIANSNAKAGVAVQAYRVYALELPSRRAPVSQPGYQ